MVPPAKGKGKGRPWEKQLIDAQPRIMKKDEEMQQLPPKRTTDEPSEQAPARPRQEGRPPPAPEPIKELVKDEVLSLIHI